MSEETCHRCCKQPARYECTERQVTWRTVCQTCFDAMPDDQWYYVYPDGRALRACYCDSAQCDICTPGAPPRGDMWNAAQILAGDNARLCGIVIEADKLAEAVELLAHLRHSAPVGVFARIQAALDAYRVVRNGH